MGASLPGQLPSQLKDKVIVVTGGGRGIGRAIAFACASRGAAVVISSRSEHELVETRSAILKEHGTRILSVVCDVSVDADVKNLFKRVESEAGPLYGLVCAAGIYGPIGPFEDIPFDEWKKGIDVNLFGTARCVHEAVPLMKGRKSGKVVLFSGGGSGPMPRFSSYVTSKGAIWRLTETLGAEFAPYGIFLNAIAPGQINTKLLDEVIAAGPEKVGQAHYDNSLRQKQQGGMSTEKAADLALYLLSHESDGLHGRLMAANYDDYRGIRNLAEISKSDLYAFRRVVTPEGGTKY